MDEIRSKAGELSFFCEKMNRAVFGDYFRRGETGGEPALNRGDPIPGIAFQGKAFFRRGGLPFRLFQPFSGEGEKTQGQAKPARRAGDQIQAEQSQQQEEPPRTVHIQETEDMEDFIGGEFVDPQVFFRGGILRNDCSEDRDHGQDDQEADR